MSATKPGLLSALSGILPTPDQTLLLRTCLSSGDEAKRAWAMWQQQIGSAKEYFRLRLGERALLPLLFTALRNHNAEVDPDFLTQLRTAFVRDDLRDVAYRQICRSVLTRLVQAEIPIIVLQDAALAETVYPNPALRHRHDLSLLVKEEDFATVLGLLPSLGFEKPGNETGPLWQEINVTHESEMPLVLHRQPFSIPFYNEATDQMWRLSQPFTITGVPVRILSPADQLLHICGQASYAASRASLRWVCDSWLLVHRYPELDWETFLITAERSQLVLPLAVMLTYLVEDLGAPIPCSVLDRLYESVSHMETTAINAAFRTARMDLQTTLRSLIRLNGHWGDRVHLLRWMLFPSSDYMRWIYPARGPWHLAFYYLYRPLEYLAYRLWWRSRRMIRNLSPTSDGFESSTPHEH